MLKKRIKWTIAILAIVVSGSILSCKDSPTSTLTSQDQIIGKWIADKVNIKCTILILPVDTTIIINNDSNYIQFYTNNTFKAFIDEALSKDIAPYSPDTGTWSLSGNTLTLNYKIKDTGIDTTLVATGTVIGNSLDMTAPIKIKKDIFIINVIASIYLSKK